MKRVSRQFFRAIRSAHASGLGPSDQGWRQVAWALIALGIAMRLVRYSLAFPLFYDEYMFAENLLSRDFGDLLRPLDNLQVAPPLFLALELAAVKLFGFSEWSLRLVPLASGIIALPFFMRLASRLLGATSCTLAVGIMASAYYPMRHAVEAKPYASDLLAAMTLLVLAVEYFQKPNQTRWLWALAFAVPFALALSFTAAFVIGGISVIMVYELARRRDRAAIPPALAYHLAVAASIAALLALSASSQMQRWGPGMREYWADSFPPPPTHPVALARWTVETFTGAMFSYPFGGKSGASFPTFACFLAGTAILLRGGRRALVALLTAPLGLGFAAGALHLYPFGDNERLVQYLAPAICLLAGLGLAGMLALWRHSVRRPVFAAFVIFFAALPCGEMIRDIVHPYKRACERDYQSFARWFWRESPGSVKRFPIPVELNAAIYPQTKYSVYKCYQSIYGPGARAIVGAHGVEDAPLEYVIYHTGNDAPDKDALDAWFRQLEPRYRVDGCMRYRIGSEVGPLHGSHDMHVYDVYRFNANQRAIAAKKIRNR